MANPFLGEIKLFANSYAPRNYAYANGQLLPIAQNTALFSLFGTLYGGDGKVTFGLPSLQDRVTVHTTSNAAYKQGVVGGQQSVTLQTGQMAQHTHSLNVGPDPADLHPPGPQRILSRSAGGFAYQGNTSANLQPMNQAAIGQEGVGGPHNNMQPFLPVGFCVALVGIYPPRG